MMPKCPGRRPSELSPRASSPCLSHIVSLQDGSHDALANHNIAHFLDRILIVTDTVSTSRLIRLLKLDLYAANGPILADWPCHLRCLLDKGFLHHACANALKLSPMRTANAL